LRINFNSLKKSKLLIDSFWSVLGNVIGYSLLFIAGVIVARILGKNLYGEYGMLKSIFTSIGMFSTFGLSYTGTKYVAELKGVSLSKTGNFIKKSAIITFVLSLLCSMLLFYYSQEIATKWLESTSISFYLKTFSLLIMLYAFTYLLLALIAGLGEFKALAKINSITGLFSFVLTTLFTIKWSLKGAMVALLLSQVINCLLSLKVIIKKIGYKSLFQKKINSDLISFKEILSFSLPIALQETIYTFSTWFINLFILWYGSYGDIGLYSAAIQWNSIILFVPGILRNVILTHLTESNSSSSFNRIFKNVSLLSFVVTFIPCVVIFALSGIIEKSYGPTFAGLDYLISIACISAIFMSIRNVYAQVFMAKGLNWQMFFIRLFGDLSVLLVAFILMNKIPLNIVDSLLWGMILSNILFLIITILFDRIFIFKKIAIL
jgi:O-antigen/teichoic acid export membrane protein